MPHCGTEDLKKKKKVFTFYIDLKLCRWQLWFALFIYAMFFFYIRF